MISCADDIIYFMNNADGQEYHFIKVKLLKDSMTVLQQIHIECADFAISVEEKILFNLKPYTKLKVTSTTTMNTQMALDMSPMIILAIHKSKHNELLMGLREQGPRYPVTKFCTRKVVVFGTDY